MDLFEDFVELGRIFYRFLVVENVSALILILVVLLVFFNLPDHTGKHILSIQYYHASLLKISRTGHNHCFINLNLSELIRILLQKQLLVRQISIRLLNQLLEFDFMAFLTIFWGLILNITLSLAVIVTRFLLDFFILE